MGYRPLLKRNALGKWQANSLKNLSKFLGHNIQSGEHSSVEDARASMMVFRKHRDAWEASILKSSRFASQSNDNRIYYRNTEDNSKNHVGNNDEDDIDIFASKKVHKKKNNSEKKEKKRKKRS